MRDKPYPSDLTDEKWEELVPPLPVAKPGGRLRSVDLREVVNGDFVRSAQRLASLDDREMPSFYPELYGPPDTIRPGEEALLSFEVSRQRPDGEFLRLQRRPGLHIELQGLCSS